MLEPYQGEQKIQAQVKSGFAQIKQKSTLVGLKLVADARIILGGQLLLAKRGQIAYFEEEILYASDWAKKKLKCDGIEEEFIMADFNFVRGFSEK